MSHLFANDTQSVWDMYDDPASDWLDTSIKRLGGDGILDRSDILDFTESVQRVFSLMSDGGTSIACKLNLKSKGVSDETTRA